MSIDPSASMYVGGFENYKLELFALLVKFFFMFVINSSHSYRVTNQFGFYQIKKNVLIFLPNIRSYPFNPVKFTNAKLLSLMLISLSLIFQVQTDGNILNFFKHFMWTASEFTCFHLISFPLIWSRAATMTLDLLANLKADVVKKVV